MLRFAARRLCSTPRVVDRFALLQTEVLLRYTSSTIFACAHSLVLSLLFCVQRRFALDEDQLHRTYKSLMVRALVDHFISCACGSVRSQHPSLLATNRRRRLIQTAMAKPAHRSSSA